MYSKKQNEIVFAPVGEEVNVNPYLALTPTKMAEMVEKGQPVSTSQLGVSYFDGTEDCDFNFPIDELRGVDITDVWNVSKESHRKMSKVQKFFDKLSTPLNT